MDNHNQEDRSVQIRIRGLYKIFGENPIYAQELARQGLSREEIFRLTGCTIGVRNADFDIYAGETLVIMGLSGSGKSTLLRCLNRLIDPTSGSVEIEGRNVTAMSGRELMAFRRKTFGMVFQHFGLFPHRSILRNAEYGLEIQKVPREERRVRATAALELVGLKGWENHKPGQLSGGMQQRVGLARALAVDPKILLMDEAFSALDPLIRVEMQDELLSLETQVQKTIIFITHDLDEALKMGDRIVLMKDGAIVQIGTPDEILSSPADDYVKRFVQNVDLTKVFTAKDVMKRASWVVAPKDGLKLALSRMRDNDLRQIHVVDKTRRLIGYLGVEEVTQAVSRGLRSIDALIHPVDEFLVYEETPVKEIFPVLHDSDNPLPVVDRDFHLKGVIWYGSMTAALAGMGRREE